ncbi:MAG TPA: hypothetical protein VMW72_07045 [Sedimentisphaerales bacterium]|nr:hypothetical protein [Sedimentisphaerales bacterium]
MGGLCLPAGKQKGIITFFKHKSKKTAKKLATDYLEQQSRNQKVIEFTL